MISSKSLKTSTTAQEINIQCSPLISGSVNSEILLIQTGVAVPVEPIVLTLYI